MPTTTHRTMIHGDLRQEQLQRVRSGRACVAGGADFPSPNLAAVITSLESGDLANIKALVKRIEDGEATCTPEEQEEVYDALVKVFGHTTDLVGMCKHREQGLAELDVQVGG